MRAVQALTLCSVSFACLVLAFGRSTYGESQPAGSPKAVEIAQLYQSGKYAEAYQRARRLALDVSSPAEEIADYAQLAVAALTSLGRDDEIDAFLERVIQRHAQNWRLLVRVAESFASLDHSGFVVDGKFHRGKHAVGGEVANTFDRDRVRALQLMAQAMPLVHHDATGRVLATFYLDWSRLLLSGRGYQETWRLQHLTDLTRLPAPQKGWYRADGPKRAPVDRSGEPVYYLAPVSWEAANCDGERWQWCLVNVARHDAALADQARWEQGQFFESQFGVQTMADYAWFFGQSDERGDHGPYALVTLKENETIARLASGIKRFSLPDECNHIRIYQQLLKNEKSAYRSQAAHQLTEVFVNRRQYTKAAEYLRAALAIEPNNATYAQKLEQIAGNWGRLEPAAAQPAGKAAMVDFRFRNCREASFEAHALDVEKLLADVKAYVQNNPQKVDWQKVDISDLGDRLVQENEHQYVKEKAAAWNVALQPRDNHADTRIKITTPLQKPGAYLLTSHVEEGNTSKIILWLDDTAIVKKTLQQGTFYFVADARTGAPIPKANLEFFGYRRRQIENANRHEVQTASFTDVTDGEGQYIRPFKAGEEQYQWIVVARGEGGRLAHLGFTSVWMATPFVSPPEQIKVFAVTDRSVYQPGETVKYKFWIRAVQFDREDSPHFANQTFGVEVHDPNGEKIFSKSLTADAYGGLDGELQLPAGAARGVYQIAIVNRGGGSFRVGEYKKPEMDVRIVAPSEPAPLGEKIEATVVARYDSGAEVSDAQLKYRITREDFNDEWFPARPWDWFYGKGYWWFAGNYSWYPNWSRWGRPRPVSPGREQIRRPPEVIAEQTVPIGADGTCVLEIDTEIARVLYGDADHRYIVSAEVIDAAGKSAACATAILVAQKPFNALAWTDHGYYRVGETVRCYFHAHTLDQKPIKGAGKVELFKVTRRAGQPAEISMRRWDVSTNAAGDAGLQIEASESGQYRLSLKLTDDLGRTAEAGYLFTIIGKGFDGSEVRFSPLELIQDKQEYAPGETVKLLVNTDQDNGTVLLFPRAANGVYRRPKTLQLKGKHAVEQLPVEKIDMPNFFVEAVSVIDGQVHTDVKEIAVPPRTRVLDVAVRPSSTTCRPGEKANVQIRVADLDGKPAACSIVATVYEAQADEVAGGSNVPNIKEFFWNWQRSHGPATDSTLFRSAAAWSVPGDRSLQNLGVFGDADAIRRSTTPLRRAGAAALRAMPLPSAATDAEKTASLAFAPSDSESSSLASKPTAFTGNKSRPSETTSTFSTFDTAFWSPALSTDHNGMAEFSLEMPDKPTTWKIKVWCLAQGTKVGEGEARIDVAPADQPENRSP